MKYKVYDAKSFGKVLKNNGYKVDRQNGTHVIWCKVGQNHICVPKSVNPMIIRRLIKENGLEE